MLLPDGHNVNHMLVKEGWCWWYRKYAPGDTVLEGPQKETREVRIPGHCGRHEFPPIGTLREFSLLISLAPPLPPSYAVALALVTHGGVVQRAIEELAEQVQ
jgi:hypothetical protein